jgi:hypothetical protein
MIKIMAAESLTELVSNLTPQEADAVREFIAYLKRRDNDFLAAADEFIKQHPDLLQRLAQ